MRNGACRRGASAALVIDRAAFVTGIAAVITSQ